MSEGGSTIETRKKPEKQENLEVAQKVESPEELRQQILSDAEHEADSFRQESENDLAQVDAKAEKGELMVDGDDRRALEELAKEAEGAKVELKMDIEKAKNNFLKYIAEGDLKSVQEICDKVALPEDFGYSPAVKKAAMEGFPKMLVAGKIDEALSIAEELSFPDEFVQSPEAKKIFLSAEGQKAGIAQLEYEFSMPASIIKDGKIAKLKEIFNFPDEVVTRMSQDGFLKNMEEGNAYYALQINKKFKLSSEFLSSPEVAVAVKKAILSDLFTTPIKHEEIGKIKEVAFLNDEAIAEIAKEAFVRVLANREHDPLRNAQEIREKFPFADEFLTSPEVQAAGKQAIIKQLSREYLHNEVLEIKNTLSLTDELFSSPEAQQAMLKMFTSNLERGRDVAEEMQKKFKFVLSEEMLSLSDVQEAAKKGFLEKLKYDDNPGYYSFKEVMEFKNKYSLPDEVNFDQRVQDFVKRVFVRCLSAAEMSFVGLASEVNAEVNLPNDFVQEEVKKAIIARLSEGVTRTASEIKEKFLVSDEIYNDDEVRKYSKVNFLKDLDNDLEMFGEKRFILEEDILSEEVQSAAKEKFMDNLVQGKVGSVLKIEKAAMFQEDFMLSADVVAAAKAGFEKNLSDGLVDEAITIFRRFSLDEDEMEEVIRSGIIEILSIGDIKKILQIKNNSLVPDEFLLSPDIIQAAKVGLLTKLSEGFSYDAKTIKNHFSIPDEFLDSPEANQSAKKGFLNMLRKGNTELAFKIKDNYKLAIDSEEIIKELELEEFLQKIKQISPEFIQQAMRSIEVLASIIPLRDNADKFLSSIRENVFLIEAVAGNPRFGAKLLVKYENLDELSRGNIKHLFDFKKDIVADNPGIDQNSAEFRKLMQEKIQRLGKNPETLAAIKKSSINLEQWLNYAQEENFRLDSGEGKTSFSEVVATPVNRIKETIDIYAIKIKEILAGKKDELSKLKINLLNAEEINIQISRMESELQKAKSEGNNRKIQGIQKGIDGLHKQIENPKTVSGWNKMVGDLAAVVQLKSDILNAQERLMQSEKEFSESTSKKDARKQKQEIIKSRGEFRNKFSLLEKRMDGFQENINKMLVATLGDEKANEVSLEIQNKLSEEFVHFSEDRNMLTNLFSENSESQKEKMEGLPMSVRVWARNPDIDLYQGNYSPCCVSIEGGCGSSSSESAIADYLTDPAIQIVNIIDETTGNPVVAAWTWLGKNEAGENILVVDNIEANTEYSSNFSDQLTGKVFEYLKKYAHDIGIDKVVLGVANNDLPTSTRLDTMAEERQKYQKIGPYNRSDEYYLEARSHNLKIIE